MESDSNLKAAIYSFRNTKLGSLTQLAVQGWKPSVVIDVGAQTGTDDLYQIFPDARHLMIEPVEEHRAQLDQVAARLTNAEVIIAAAGARSGEMFLHVSPNSLVADISASAVATTDHARQVRRISCFSVDDLCRQRSLAGPYLLKIDVDGTELAVLEGAAETLKDTGCVIVETVFFGRKQNKFNDVVNFMQRHDFTIHDLIEPVYRPIDMALWQIDTVFVKREGVFRRLDEYAESLAMTEGTSP